MSSSFVESSQQDAPPPHGELQPSQQQHPHRLFAHFTCLRHTDPLDAATEGRLQEMMMPQQGNRLVSSRRQLQRDLSSSSQNGENHHQQQQQSLHAIMMNHRRVLQDYLQVLQVFLDDSNNNNNSNIDMPVTTTWYPATTAHSSNNNNTHYTVFSSLHWDRCNVLWNLIAVLVWQANHNNHNSASQQSSSPPSPIDPMQQAASLTLYLQDMVHSLLQSQQSSSSLLQLLDWQLSPSFLSVWHSILLAHAQRHAHAKFASLARPRYFILAQVATATSHYYEHAAQQLSQYLLTVEEDDHEITTKTKTGTTTTTSLLLDTSTLLLLESHLQSLRAWHLLYSILADYWESLKHKEAATKYRDSDSNNNNNNNNKSILEWQRMLMRLQLARTRVDGILECLTLEDELQVDEEGQFVLQATHSILNQIEEELAEIPEAIVIQQLQQYEEGEDDEEEDDLPPIRAQATVKTSMEAAKQYLKVMLSRENNGSDDDGERRRKEQEQGHIPEQARFPQQQQQQYVSNGGPAMMMRMIHPSSNPPLPQQIMMHQQQAPFHRSINNNNNNSYDPTLPPSSSSFLPSKESVDSKLLQHYHDMFLQELSSLHHEMTSIAQNKTETARRALHSVDLPHALTIFQLQQQQQDDQNYHGVREEDRTNPSETMGGSNSQSGVPSGTWMRVSALQQQGQHMPFSSTSPTRSVSRSGSDFITRIKQSMWQLKEMSEVAKELYHGVQDQLQQDAQMDQVFRQEHVDFTGHDVSQVQQVFWENLQHYQHMLDTAQASDQVLSEQCQVLDSDPKFQLLMHPKSELDKLVMPSITQSRLLPAPRVTFDVTTLSQLLIELSTLFDRREEILKMLLQNIQEFPFDDELVGLIASGAGVDQALSTTVEQAKESVQEYVDEMEASIEQQNELLRRILHENEEFTRARDMNQRTVPSDDCLVQIEDALDEIDEFHQHLQEGTDFYDVIIPKLEKIKMQVGDVSARLAVERMEYEDQVALSRQEEQDARMAASIAGQHLESDGDSSPRLPRTLSASDSPQMGSNSSLTSLGSRREPANHPGVEQVGHHEPMVRVDDSKVAALVAMDFDSDKVVAALRRYDNNFDEALNELLSG